MNDDFQRNLRLLTEHYKSIADACRRLGINRSQYNKYLSGRSYPSRHIFKKLCDFFGVEEYEILLPHDEFENIVRLKMNVGSPSLSYTSYLDQLVNRSRNDLKEYQGFYFEYSYSMAYPGQILRSLIRVSSDAGVTSYQRLENLARVDQAGPRVRGRYQGLAFYLNDRIFLVDFESLVGIEISQTILYPNNKTRLTRLAGLKLGVSASNRRDPLCARVVWVALGHDIDVRSALRQCGLYDPESPEIELDIKATIENSIGDGAFHFSVVTDGL